MGQCRFRPLTSRQTIHCQRKKSRLDNNCNTPDRSQGFRSSSPSKPCAAIREYRADHAPSICGDETSPRVDSMKLCRYAEASSLLHASPYGGSAYTFLKRAAHCGMSRSKHPRISIMSRCAYSGPQPTPSLQRRLRGDAWVLLINQYLTSSYSGSVRFADHEPELPDRFLAFQQHVAGLLDPCSDVLDRTRIGRDKLEGFAGVMPSMAFFNLRMGRGQLSPVQSMVVVLMVLLLVGRQIGTSGRSIWLDMLREGASGALPDATCSSVAPSMETSWIHGTANASRSRTLHSGPQSTVSHSPRTAFW